MLRLAPTQRTTEQLKALAASGASGLAKSAQAELVSRRSEQLRAEWEARRAPGGPKGAGATVELSPLAPQDGAA